MRAKHILSSLAGGLAIALVVALILSLFPQVGQAADPSSIQQELEALQAEADEIDRQQKELQQQIDNNTSQVESVIDQKKTLDQQIRLIYEEIENINGQIQVYNQMIVSQQEELDAALLRQKELTEQYTARIRAMEKNRHKSYWSVLFEADSFADFIDDLHMMADIARADQKMMEDLETAAREIENAQIELSAEKAGLDAQRAALVENQNELDQKNAMANLLLDELNDSTSEMQELMEEYERKEAELSDEIADKEKEYTDAISGVPSPGDTSSSGWLYPLPNRVPITDAYGWRNHVITGKYSFHHGVDFAAGMNTPIYASRSGTVSEAVPDDEIYGNYVTINHGDGYSSLYAHMTYYTVSDGEYVKQGQVIGYVGSTGWSSGPHLHFSIYYNGSSVNPMNYVG